jgi:alanyl aminopeptidase
VASHEQAHQWFGNLVTMVWWDDIWLNEAFASWAGDKAMDRVMKDWDPRWSRLKTREQAMSADSVAAARKIRQPVASNDGIGEAFDRITYDKGKTVLEMAEAWVGEEPFRQGVHEYLTRHARKNTTGEDFVRTIAEVTKHPELPGLLATFLEQGGLPSVKATLSCRPGETPSVKLSQERFLKVPSADAGNTRWSIPFCLRTPAARQCTVLKEREQTISLEGAKGCPKWLHLDADQRGYYHAAYTPEQLIALFSGWSELTPAERSGVLHDATMDVGRGGLPAGQFLAALSSARLLQTDDPVQLVAIVRLYDELLLLARHAGLEAPMEAHIVRELGPRARALGWLGAPADTDDVRLARIDVVSLVAEAGEPALVAEAVRLSDRVLRGEPAVPADIALSALKVSAGRRRTDVRPFLEAARKSKDAVFRYLVYTALGFVRDPAALTLVRDFILSADFEWTTRGQIDLVVVGHAYPSLLPGTLDFVEKNYDTLAERIPKGGAFGDLSVDMVRVGEYGCDAATKERIARFFGPRNEVRDGGPRETATTLEKIDGCARTLAIQRKGLEAFFGKGR